MYADGYEEPEGYCVKLENIFFYSDSGLLQHKDKIIEESGMDLKRIVSMKNVYKKIIGYNPKLKTLKELTCTSVMHLPLARSNIYHWFIECLGRIYLLKKYFQSQVTVLMHDDIKSFN